MNGNEVMQLRSFMFLPAHNRKFIEKAVQSDADALILDVEDSVPPGMRAEARESIILAEQEGLLQGKRVFVRINPIGTKDFADDIFSLALESIDGFMPSKIDCAEDILFLDRLLETVELRKSMPLGKFRLAPLIETAKAILNVDEIAQARSRLVAMCFGGEDYLNDIGCIDVYQESAFVYPRARIINAARAAGILPVDTPYLDIGNLSDFGRAAREAYANGFAGVLLINPKQIEVANQSFSPTAEKIAAAKEIVQAIEKAKNTGQGVVILDNGRMAGPPMQKRAVTILRQMEGVQTTD